MAASETDESVYSMEDPLHTSLLSSGLNALRHQADFCDVTIIVGEQRFPAHKAVLTSASDYFQGMFSGKFQESVLSEITVPGSADSFAQILEFLYTGRFTLTPTSVVGVLEMACYMVLTAVENLCAKCLKNAQDKLTKEDCFEVWSISSNHSNLSEIAKMYRRIFVQNYLKSLQSKGFLENSSVSTMLDILDDEEIETDDITEEQILEGTMIWMRYDWDQRKVHAVDLLKKIRLGLVPVDRLHQILGEELLSLPECKSMVGAVVKLSANKDTAIPPLNKSHPDLFATRNTITAQVYVRYATYSPRVGGIVSLACHYESGCYMLNKLNSDAGRALSCRTSGEINGTTVVSKTGQLFALLIKKTESSSAKDYFLLYDTEKIGWRILPPMPVRRHIEFMCGLDQYIYVILQDRFVIERFNVHSQTWEVMIDHDYEVGSLCATCVDDKGIVMICDVTVEGPNELGDEGEITRIRIMYYNKSTNECLDVTVAGEYDLDWLDMYGECHILQYDNRMYLAMAPAYFDKDTGTDVFQCTCDFDSHSPTMFIDMVVDGELRLKVLEELKGSVYDYTFDKRKLDMVPMRPSCPADFSKDHVCMTFK